MSTFEPFRKSNAIDEIAFVLQFRSFISSNEFVKNLIVSDLGLKKELPDYDIISSFTIQVGEQQAQSTPSNQPTPGNHIGIIFFKKSENDPKRFEWSLKVENNRIVVTCSEYTDWAEVSTKAKTYFREVLAKFSFEDNPIVEITYQCLDKFICRGSQDGETIAFEGLFDFNSGFLTKKIITENPHAWHIHQGWFETSGRLSAQMLHNLNLNMSSKRPFALNEASVSHLIRVHNLKLTDENHLFGGASQAGYLTNVLKETHTANKEIISKLLCKPILKKIGMKDE